MGAAAVIAPGLLLLGLSAEKAQTPQEPLLAGLDLAAEELQRPATSHEHLGLWGDLPIVTRVWGDGTAAFVELEPTSALRRPDLLVYWTPSSQAVVDFPKGARMLGRLAGQEPRRFALPNPAGAGRGVLVLYSLGHQTQVGSASIPEGPGAEASPGARTWD